MASVNRMKAFIHENPHEYIDPVVEKRRSTLMDEIMFLTSVIEFNNIQHIKGQTIDLYESERRKIQWKDRADEFVSLGSKSDSSNVDISEDAYEAIKIETDDLMLLPVERLRELRNALINMVNVLISNIDFFDNEEIESKLAATDRVYTLYFMYKTVTRHLQVKNKIDSN